MDNHFGLSRDLLYLASLLAGASAGAFLVTLRRSCTLRQKSRWITVILCLIACTMASLAASVILTKGTVFTVYSVYPLVVLFFVMGAAGLYFPRAGGCAIIIITGFYAVWISFSFLVIPRCKDPIRLTVRSSGSEFIFHQDDEIWKIQDNGGTITVKAASITAHSSFPLIGGEQRGMITGVLRNGADHYESKIRRIPEEGSAGPGFFREFYAVDLPKGAMLPGVSLSVLFDGNKLYFDPPIRY